MAEKVVIGNAELWLGDCREVLPMLPKVDALITDPPYGYSYESNRTDDAGRHAPWRGDVIANDHDLSAREFALAWAGQRPWAVFGSWKMPKPAEVRAVLIWDKGPASGMGDLSFPWKGSWEEVYVGGYGWTGSRDEGVIKGHWVVTRASMGRAHPNEKPVSLMCELVKKVPTYGVLDPFMGSGTTGVACAQLGRKFVGVEIDRRYFDIACERISRAQAQGTLLPPEKPPEPVQEGLL